MAEVKPDLLNDLPTSAKSKNQKGAIKKIINYNSTGSYTKARSAQSTTTKTLVSKQNSNLRENKSAQNAKKDVHSKQVLELVEKELSVDDILQKTHEANIFKVYDIDLHQQHLKSLPFILKEFTKLKSLDLSCNDIENMENLFGNKELKELKLYDNKIKIICNLNDSKELISLQLQHNVISKIGTGLSPLRKLTTLRLDNNCIASIEVKEFAPLAQLSVLDLSFNQLKDITAVVCLYNLEELCVSNNLIQIIPDLSRCKKLKELDISKNCLNDVLNLRGATALEKLDVSYNRLELFSTTAKLNKLNTLNVAHNSISDFSWLTDVCSALEILDISDNNINDISTDLREELFNLSNLNELNFLNCATLHNVVYKWLPQLELFNGIPTVRPSSTAGSSRPTTPLMRPMSAAANLSIRSVESQMKNMETMTQPLEDETEKAFNDLLAKLNTLATQTDKIEESLAELKEDRLHSPQLSLPNTHRQTSSQSASSTPRPSSRASTRLKDALQFSRQSTTIDN